MDKPMAKKLRELTQPSPWIEDWAHLQWAWKTSLWKHIWFNDIFFLWNAFRYPYIRSIGFELEPPAIQDTWMDPNWKLFFLRYITDWFTTNTKNFWKEHFYNDQNFWWLVKSAKEQVDSDVNWVDLQIIWNYWENNKFSLTFFELLLSENYFNNILYDSKPWFEKVGMNRDYFENFILNNQISKVEMEEYTKDIFATSAHYVPPFTLTGLWHFNHEYQLRHWEKYDMKKNFASKLYQISKNLDFFADVIKTNSNQDFIEAFEYDLDVPLYSFTTLENFDLSSVKALRSLVEWPIPTAHLELLYWFYTRWLSKLESLLGFRENNFNYTNNEIFTPSLLLYAINWRLNVLTNSIKWANNEHSYFDFLPTFAGVELIFYKYLNPFFLISAVERKFLKGTLGYSDDALEKRAKGNPNKFLIFKDYEIDKLITLEVKVWELELLMGLWNSSIIISDSNSTITNSSPKAKNSPVSYPWYMWLVQYLGQWDHWFIMPGFVWYYSPTPFPFPFSTFGFFWNKYQYIRKNLTSTVVGYSDSIAELHNSTPLALYSGVEAILYVKPLLDLFDFIIWKIVSFINRGVEIIITQDFISPLTSLFSMIFFAHFVWFIDFYIYAFIFFYFMYYFLRYYFHKIGFVWFYERMFEETVLSSYSNKTFWHSINDIWINYWTPEQYLLFSLHTNLLVHYTFFNYNNFYFYTNSWIVPIIWLLLKLMMYEKKFLDFSVLTSYFSFVPNTMKKWNNFFVFWSFYNINCIDFKALLFTGGVECSPDHLIWSYYEYLNHVSLYLSWALQKNIYYITENDEFGSLMKIFTVLVGSISLIDNFYLLMQPVLDTLLTWKLFLNLFYLLEKNCFLSKLENWAYFLFSLQKDSFPILYTMIQSNWFEFYNYYITSGLDIYEYFNARITLYLTKTNSSTFWDDKKYWLLAFFWSFRFLPKYWFVGGNIHLSYETSRLSLAWIAYSNSWIAQSTYVRPFFNLVQHIWWTSRIYNAASTLISAPYNLNQPGVGAFDDVRNFSEKWYSWTNSYKIETIFGLVWSIDLQPCYEKEGFHYLVPYENKNFDLSFPEQLIDKKTTNRGYLKTNPPLNLIELGITPLYLLKLFLWLPKGYIKFYLTFYVQLYHILKDLMLVDWNLQADYEWLSIFEGVIKEEEHEFYSKYDFYIKEFDFLLNIAMDQVSKNWIFSFDSSFFLSHFWSWDYFSWEFSSLRPNILKENYKVNQEINSMFISNLDMIANLWTTDNWFLKSFGLLDKMDLYSMKKYKLVKILDEKSFSWNWEDVFSSLDWEHTVSEIGLAVYPKDDPKNLLQAYKEEYNALRWKRFPYNPTLIHNSIAPLIVGWVGNIVTATRESLNLCYSLLYASPSPDVNAWRTENEIIEHWIKSLGKIHKFESFFGKSVFQQQLQSWSFSWLNLILFPTAYWYSYGPKVLAWNDYWSWKTGLTFDYKNGFYTYRPYLGFWHALGSWLASYDNLYGFYRTYRQIDDDPFSIDHSTDAIEHLKTADDEELFEDIKHAYGGVSKEINKDDYDPRLLVEFSLPYWEIYYSFQHPYFIGHLLFWVFLFFNYFNYLGLVNYSFKWFMLYEFILNNSYVNFDFWGLIYQWKITENWFWRQMFKYWIFYTNPIGLINSLDYVVDTEVLQPMDDINTLQNFFLKNCFLFSFLKQAMWFSATDICFALDFKKIYTNMYLINWLSLDMPFCVNPYLVTSFHWFFTDSNLVLKLYYSYFLSFSRHSTVNENFNFNLFFDWTTCSFLDTINLISYVGTYRGSAGLNELFFENPSFIAAFFVKFKTDKSADVAKSLWLARINFNYSDLLLGGDMALNNLCLIDFFHETLDFLAAYEGELLVKWNIFSILKFYFEAHYFANWATLSVFSSGKVDFDGNIKPPVTPKFLKFKQLYFVYWLQKSLNYDSFLVLLSSGLLFTTRIWLGIFYKSLWFWLFTRYDTTYRFYKWIGLYLGLFFLKWK